MNDDRQHMEPEHMEQSICLVGGHSIRFGQCQDTLDNVVAHLNNNRKGMGIAWRTDPDTFTGSIEARAKLITNAETNYFDARAINTHPTHRSFKSMQQLTKMKKYIFTEDNDVVVYKQILRSDGR